MKAVVRMFMNFSPKQGQSWTKCYIVNLLFSEIGMKGILSSGQPPRDRVLYGYGHAGKFTILQYSVYSWGIADSSTTEYTANAICNLNMFLSTNQIQTQLNVGKTYFCLYFIRYTNKQKHVSMDYKTIFRIYLCSDS